MGLVDTYMNNSRVPKRYLKEIELVPSVKDECSFEYLANISEHIDEFVSDGNNILIWSNECGNGKTTWATKILKSYIGKCADKIYKNYTPALYINVTNFLNEKKLAIDNSDLAEKVKQIEKSILTAKLVIFDDIGVKNISQYDLGNLYYWVDERTSNLKSCIFTSNLAPQQLQTVLDGRLYSRIVNYSTLVEIKDGDNRKLV